MRTRLLVTGGLGFIGSAFIRWTLMHRPKVQVINLDKMTYAASPSNLRGLQDHLHYSFVQGDINDQPLVEKLCIEQKVDTIVHFAAETHVDRSLVSAHPFIETNIYGTWALLEVVRRLPHIHFHHISTDEVYGSLGENGLFNEQSPYCPNSPYSASKAASDHFVRAYTHSYSLSTTLSHCSNNYGPGQHKEKFIPLIIDNCLNQKPLPIYGEGKNVRDWLYVDDHVEALWSILEKGERGEVYTLGGNAAVSNVELLHLLLHSLARHTGEDPEGYFRLIQFVHDRPGHDFRYAIDASKTLRTLGWAPRTSLSDGLYKTIRSFV